MAQSERPQWSGPERRDRSSRHQLVNRFRLEYRELPGMSLTADQAARLFAVRPEVCQRIFEELVDAGVLLRKWEGQYIARRQDS
jgi:hypothetical protein